MAFKRFKTRRRMKKSSGRGSYPINPGGSHI